MWPILITVKKVAELVYMVCIFATVQTVSYVTEHHQWIWNYNASQTKAELGGRLAKYMDDPWKRIPYAVGALFVGTPLMPAIVVLSLVCIPTVLYITADQMLYPVHDLPPELKLNAENMALVDKMTDADKSHFMLNAITRQLRVELDTFPGWIPNDLNGWSPLLLPGLSDNRASRQLGVQYETQVLVDAWGLNTSKYGMNDSPSQDLVDAATQSFNQKPTAWLFPSAEAKYEEGFAQIKAYQEKVSAWKATVNVTKANLVNFLKVMQEKGIAIPLGKVNQRTARIGFMESDNDLYYAEGAGIVIRDALAAFRLVYHKELSITNAMDNLDEGISSLDSLAHFNPWMVLAGEHDSMQPSHPGKASTYLNDANSRLDDIYTALNGKS